jgi:DNA-binding transcriptional LysR family regulator
MNRKRLVPSVEHISRRLTLRHLNVLLAVIEQGSMAKAADRLAITQPVISKAIADLEVLLGVRLLERGPKGIEPTLYGLALLKRSVSIFDDLKASIFELKSLANPGTGHLRIGCTEAMGAALVPAIVHRLSERWLGMDFEVFIADPATLLERDLRGRRVDLIAGPFPLTAGEDIDVTLLHHDRLYVVSGPANPLLKRRKIALSDLVSQRWILPPPTHPIGALIMNAFQQSGLHPPRNVVTVTSASFTTRLIADGQFLGVLTSAVLRDPYCPLKALAVELSAMAWPSSIATLKGRMLVPAAKLFIDCALELVHSETRPPRERTRSAK